MAGGWSIERANGPIIPWHVAGRQINSRRRERVVESQMGRIRSYHQTTCVEGFVDWGNCFDQSQKITENHLASGL